MRGLQIEQLRSLSIFHLGFQLEDMRALLETHRGTLHTIALISVAMYSRVDNPWQRLVAFVRDRLEAVEHVGRFLLVDDCFIVYLSMTPPNAAEALHGRLDVTHALILVLLVADSFLLRGSNLLCYKPRRAKKGNDKGRRERASRKVASTQIEC